jgi:hypothetical protein
VGARSRLLAALAAGARRAALFDYRVPEQKRLTLACASLVFASPTQAPAATMGDQAALEKVEAEIQALEAKLEALEAEIREARAAHDTEEVAALRAKEAQLRAKEGQLRAEKAQLREKEIVLLKRQPGALSLRRTRCKRVHV